MTTSWRDSASPQAQDDLDGLVNAALPFATQQLEKHGEFYPYGVSLGIAGDEWMVTGDPRSGESPASADVLATLVERLRRERDDLRAIAVVADVRWSDVDAIRVELEHREGQAIAILLPYKKKRFGRGVEFGSLTAGQNSTQIWGA
jgi:hypothetical protein